MEWLGIVLAISQAIGAIGQNAQQIKTLFSSDCKPEIAVYRFVGQTKDTVIGGQRIVIERRNDTTNVILLPK